MTGYAVIAVDEIIREVGEDDCANLLSTFSCPINKDVEMFIRDKNKVIEFAKQRIAMTYIVMASYKDKPVLVGYFTIANKIVHIRHKNLSKRVRSRISKFAKYDAHYRCYPMSAPLIAQLGKNYSKYYDSLIKGEELLKIACNKVKEGQMILGGKFVYLECEDNEKLVDFYSENGFVICGKRRLDNDETPLIKGEYLLQLFKYLH